LDDDDDNSHHFMKHKYDEHYVNDEQTGEKQRK